MVHLDAPDYLHRCGYVEWWVIIFCEDVAVFVVEDKVVGSEHFDDACSWWVDMVIDFVLGGLCIFADARSDEMGEGHYIKK